MKVKTNVRAGQGGADDTGVDTSSSSSSTSSSNQKQKQGGKSKTPVVYYSRCTGL